MKYEYFNMLEAMAPDKPVHLDSDIINQMSVEMKSLVKSEDASSPTEAAKMLLDELPGFESASANQLKQSIKLLVNAYKKNDTNKKV